MHGGRGTLLVDAQEDEKSLLCAAGGGQRQRMLHVAQHPLGRGGGRIRNDFLLPHLGPRLPRSEHLHAEPALFDLHDKHIVPTPCGRRVDLQQPGPRARLPGGEVVAEHQVAPIEQHHLAPEALDAEIRIVGRRGLATRVENAPGVERVFEPPTPRRAQAVKDVVAAFGILAVVVDQHRGMVARQLGLAVAFVHR